MTLKQIIVEIFEALGEPSDLEIYSDRDTDTIGQTLPGWKRLVDVVNSGCLALGMWKWPNGRQVRMRFPDAVAFMKTTARSGAATSVTSTSMSVAGLPAGSNLQAGKLVVGQTSGATATVLWSNGVDLVLTNVVGTFSEVETVKLYQREYKFTAATAGSAYPTAGYGIPYFAANGTPLEVVQVEELSSQTVLASTARYERFLAPGTEVGTPGSIQKLPAGFLFDSWPTDGLAFAVRYMRGPKVLAYTDETTEPELPSQFHPGLVLYGIWWGYRRNQESNDAYSAKQDLNDFMARTRTEYDLQDELARGQIKMYPEGM